MLTKDDLLQDDAERAKEEKRRKKESDKFWAKERARWEAEHMAKVRGPFSELDDLLRKLNAEGHKTVRFDQHHTWIRKHEEWSEYYSGRSPLDFEPKKEYPPTMVLVRKLRRGGFSVKLETEDHQNVQFVTTADGYNIIDAPGTHPVYYMRISWK